MKTILGMIKQFDFLSEKAELYINQNIRFKTMIGGLLGMLTGMVIVAASINFSIELLSRKYSTIIYNQLLSQNVSKNISDMPWAVMLQDESFRPIEDEDRYYYMSASFWQTVPDGSTGIMQLETNITQIKLERCDLEIHFGKYREYFTQIPFLEHHYCPVIGKSNITLYGSFGDVNPYSLIETWIRRCDNHTRINKRMKCFSEDKINANLKKTFLSFKFLDYAIDHSNLDYPSSMYLRSEAININPSLYKRNWYLYRIVNYASDAGLIFEDKVSQLFSQVSSLKEQIDIQNEGYEKGSFSQLSIGFDKMMDTYMRQYIKSQQTLANVGGITKGLLVIAAFLNFLLSQELYYFELIKSIFIEFNTTEDNIHFKNNLKELNANAIKELK